MHKVCQKVKAAEVYMSNGCLVVHLTNSINIACKLHIINILHRANNKSALSVAVYKVKSSSSSSRWASCSIARIVQQESTAKNIVIPPQMLQRQQ